MTKIDPRPWCLNLTQMGRCWTSMPNI